jgi:hypothetical protein
VTLASLDTLVPVISAVVGTTISSYMTFRLTTIPVLMIIHMYIIVQHVKTRQEYLTEDLAKVVAMMEAVMIMMVEIKVVGAVAIENKDRWAAPEID